MKITKKEIKDWITLKAAIKSSPEDVAQNISIDRSYYLPGRTFGDYCSLASQSYKKGTVVALEACKCIEVPIELIIKLIDEMSLSENFQVILNFLNTAIPSFYKFGKVKERFASSFKEIAFKRGQVIVKESQPISKIYVIKEGECKIEVTMNPLQYIANLNNHATDQGNAVDTDLQSKRGLLSDTFTSFLIGSFSKSEWIGNDFLATGIDEYEYTAIATSDMLLYEIDKKDISIMPQEFVSLFRDSLRERQKWIRERISSNSKSISLIMKKQDTGIEYNEMYNKVQRKYPNASKDIQLQIRKKILYSRKDEDTTNVIKMPEIKLKMSNEHRESESPIATHKARKRERIGSLNLKYTTKLPESSTIVTDRLNLDKNAEIIRKMVTNKATSLSPVKSFDKKVLLMNSSVVDLAPKENKLLPAISARKERKTNTTTLPKLSNHSDKKLDVDVIRNHLKKKFEEKEYKNFIICRRTIEIMDKDSSKREKTPNPFTHKSDAL